ncbi:hypothetical protein Tco_0855221 [Tanacetum coccineum]
MEQIVPRSQWLTIWKSNFFSNAQKDLKRTPSFGYQGHPKCNTKLLPSLHCLSQCSAIYLLTALAITPVIPAQPFELPPSGNTVIDFVNEQGYPEPCLTGKTFGSISTQTPVLQMLWGIVTQTNVVHAGALWEEFLKGSRHFSPHKQVTSRLKNQRRVAPSPILLDGNSSLSLKGESVDVLEWQFPIPLITEAYNNPVLSQVLVMVARNTREPLQESASVQPTTRVLLPKKPTTLLHSNHPSQLLLRQRNTSKHKLHRKLEKESLFNLVMMMMQAQQESFSRRRYDPDSKWAKMMRLESYKVKRRRRGDDGRHGTSYYVSLDLAFLPLSLELLEE